MYIVIWQIQAYKLLYTYQDDKGTSWQAMEIGTMVSNKVYYIKYDTEPRQFAMDMPIVQNITESFRIGIH